MNVQTSKEIEPGDAIEYRHGDELEKAIVLAPAFYEGFWQVEHIADDNGAFAIVAERDMQPATLDKDEKWFGDLIAERLLS
jgi:hypothetical protein